jgi:hypothetical protein
MVSRVDSVARKVRWVSTYLVVDGIDDVNGLHDKDQPHASGDVGESSEPDALLTQTSDVEHEPENETGSELVELFDVKFGIPRRRGVEWSAHEELVVVAQC